MPIRCFYASDRTYEPKSAPMLPFSVSTTCTDWQFCELQGSTRYTWIRKKARLMPCFLFMRATGLTNPNRRWRSILPFLLLAPISNSTNCQIQVWNTQIKITDRRCLSVIFMRATGLEPAQPCDHKNLNLTRLPIPPRPRINYEVGVAEFFCTRPQTKFLLFIFTRSSSSRRCLLLQLKLTFQHSPQSTDLIISHFTEFVKRKQAFIYKFISNYLPLSISLLFCAFLR